MITLREAKGNFFDRTPVIKALDAAARRVLSRFGAFVRTRARTSIRKRKGTSAPGGPPYSHVGLLRSLIFFGYDPGERSVVIGPVLTNKPTGAPENLEYGGEAEIPQRGGRSVKAKIRPRPYMGPSFRAETPQLEGLWRDSVR